MQWFGAVLATFFVATSTGCVSMSGESVPQGEAAALDRPFTLKPGETVSVGRDRTLQVRFDRVVTDSRCPRDVQCVRAGEAVVRATLMIQGRSAEPVEVKTSPNGASASVGGYRLTLNDLVPLPLSTAPVRPADYRATFVVSASRN